MKGLRSPKGMLPRANPAHDAFTIQGRDVSSTPAPSVGDVLVWSGTAWVPGDVGSAGIAADAVGANALSPTALRGLLGFVGRNNVGACTLPTVKAGDKVVSVTRMDLGPPFTRSEADFQTTITVNDQIQQLAVGDLSARAYLVLLVAKGG